MNGQAMGGQVVASTVALAGAGDEAAFAQLRIVRTPGIGHFRTADDPVAVVIGQARRLAQAGFPA